MGEYLKTREGVYWLITLNFIDLIMGLAGNNPVVAVVAKGANGLKKGQLTERLQNNQGSNFAKIIAGAMGDLFAKKGIQPVWLKRLVGKQSGEHGFNEHFPHPNLYLAALLNAFMLSGGLGKEAAVEAGHVVHETGVGVGMIAGLTAMADGIQFAEGSVFARLQQEEDTEVRQAMGDTPATPETRIPLEQIPGRMAAEVTALTHIIGPAPLVAAMMQVPLLAFGNADLTRIRLEHSLTICRRLFWVFQGYSVRHVRQWATPQNIPNPSIRKAILDGLRTLDGQEILNLGQLTRIGEAFFADIGLGLMSSTMDVTQGIGDVAPAIVGSYQSFGAEQMLKTAGINGVVSLLNGLHETQMVAQRLGVPVGQLLNRETIKHAFSFWVRSLYNLASGIIGADSDHGAKFRLVTGVLDNITNLLKAIGGGTVNTFSSIAGRSVDHVLINQAVEVLQGVRQDIEREVGQKMIEDPGAIQSLSELKVPLAALKDMAGLSGKQVKRQAPGVVGELKTTITTALPAAASIQERLAHAAEMIEHDPALLDLFKFDYWEKHVGPTMAETLFVVTAQGLSLKGLETVISKYVYPAVVKLGTSVDATLHHRRLDLGLGHGKRMQRSVGEVASLAGSSLIHSGISAVADNWADQILHAKQLSDVVLLDPILREFNIRRDQVPVPEGANVYDAWMAIARQGDRVIQTRNGDQTGQRIHFAERLYDKFLLAKHVSIWFAIFGGGESTIGNSPHFRAFVAEIKQLITLEKSFQDVVTHFRAHTNRFMRTLAEAVFVAPTCEMLTSDNPFLPADLATPRTAGLSKPERRNFLTGAA